MTTEPNDFEIIEAALTGWDNPEPTEVPPARAALERIKAHASELEDMMANAAPIHAEVFSLRTRIAELEQKNERLDDLWKDEHYRSGLLRGIILRHGTAEAIEAMDSTNN